MQHVSRIRKIIAAGTLVLVGAGGGAALVVGGSASAADTTAAAGAGRAEETPLTGTTLEQVTAAVLADYPGAEIKRAETDSDGVYEAHILTTDDERLTVLVDEDFAVTGTQQGGGGRGGHGGRGGPGHGGHGETPLTGTTLEQVTAAVLADYPGAEIKRAETDSDGVYEAHILTTDDERLTVLVDEDFAVTGAETHGDRGDGGDGGDEADQDGTTAS